MDTLIRFQHNDLAEGRWEIIPFSSQLGNIGSEVSRALKWRGKNEERSLRALDRALELIDLTIMSKVKKIHPAAIKELCRGREVLCDYFYGNNYYESEPESLLKYYDDFTTVLYR